MPLPRGYKRKKLANWRRVCAKGSVRTKVNGKVRVLVCCPRGKWQPRKMRCLVGMKGVAIDKPKGFGTIKSFGPMPGLGPRSNTYVAERKGGGEYVVYKDWSGTWRVTFRPPGRSEQSAREIAGNPWKSKNAAVKAMHDHEVFYSKHFARKK